MAHPNNGAIRLNGFVWGIIVGLAMAVVATHGTLASLPLFLLLGLVAPLGLCANLVLLLWTLFTGRLRQAFGYVLGGLVLAVLLFGLNQDAAQRYLGFLPALPVAP